MKQIFRILPALLLLSAGILCFPNVFSAEPPISSSSVIPYQSAQNDPLHARRYQLKNGLTVYLVQNKRAPRIQSYIAVRAGSADELPRSTGLAHYFEHMMFKGSSKIASLNWAKEKPVLEKIEVLFEQRRNTKDPEEQKKLYLEIDRLSSEAARYSNDELWNLMNAMGASDVNAWTSYDHTAYQADIPAGQLEKYLILESERFRDISLRRFHTELETVYEEFNRGQDMDSRQAFRAMMSQLFQVHPYQRDVIGLPQHLKTPSMRDIRIFFKHYYVPENMAIVLSGDFEFDPTIALIDRYFGSLKNSGLPIDRSARQVQEPPITAPRIVEVTGPEKESILMAYRFPRTPENEPVLTLLADVLHNGKSGFLDKNLILPQKVQSVKAGLMNLNDFLVLLFSATPKQGQTLDELQALIQQEIEALKQGQFEPWLLNAICNNRRYDFLLQTENRNDSAMMLLDTFCSDRTWEQALKEEDELALVTKEQIVDFAKKNLNQNYVLVRKLSGKPEKRIHAEKPPITPVEVSTEPSAFAKALDKIPSGPAVQPVFVDFEKQMSRSLLPRKDHSSAVELFTVKNPDNERFSLSYQFPVGSAHDLYLELAAQYADLLGTNRFTPSGLQNEFYKHALHYSFSVSKQETTFTISGLQKNFALAQELMNHIIRELKPDPEAYGQFVSRIEKARENEKKSAQSILSGAINYAAYGGGENPFRRRIPISEMKQWDPRKNLNPLLNSLFRMPWRIIYFGPRSHEEVKAELQLPSTTIFPDNVPLPAPVKFTLKPQTENRVFYVNYPGTQAKLMLLRVVGDRLFDPAYLPFADLYSKYAHAVVWKKIRETQGLAYVATSFFSLPGDPDNRMAVYGFVGTQPDKLTQALDSLLEVMNSLPEEANTWAGSKSQILQQLSTERINPDSIYGFFRKMERFHRKDDWRKLIFDGLSPMDQQTFFHWYQDQFANRPYALVIVADETKLDPAILQKYGKVQKLELKDLFL